MQPIQIMILCSCGHLAHKHVTTGVIRVGTSAMLTCQHSSFGSKKLTIMTSNPNRNRQRNTIEQARANKLWGRLATFGTHRLPHFFCPLGLGEMKLVTNALDPIKHITETRNSLKFARLKYGFQRTTAKCLVIDPCRKRSFRGG